MTSYTIELVFLIACLFIILRLIFGEGKGGKSSTKVDKKTQLSKMMDQMEKEFEEKSKKGDSQASQRRAELAMFRDMLNSKCKHEWVGDGCGRLYCKKCGEDGGSPWDC